MQSHLDDELLRALRTSSDRILFHGTRRQFEGFTEASIGTGAEANSALGIHLTDFPHLAADYADGASPDEGDYPQVLVVRTPVSKAFEERDNYTFFGYNDEGIPDSAMGKAGFSKWRASLQQSGFDAVDYEDGEGPIVVALDPGKLEIIARLTLKEAYMLSERLSELEDEFNTAQRLDALLSLGGEPEVKRARSPRP